MMVYVKHVYTINGERFAGLNFPVFRCFQEYHESFSMNIYLAILYKHLIMALCFKHKAPQKLVFHVKNFIGWNP